MANSYFQFKQFRIEQDRTAMKVCTDACIFGAWVDTADAEAMLDIGTGTGLLSLMLAQKSLGQIDAVEIEAHACKQAIQNIENSPWTKRIALYHESIQNYVLKANKKYDLIISNPPFYTHQLKSPDLKKNIALHSEELSLQDLASAVSTLLKKDGIFYILLPPQEFESFTATAHHHHLYPAALLYIQDREEKPVFRVAGSFTFAGSGSPVNTSLIIKDREGKYTSEFKDLLKDYYLNL